MIIRFSAIVLIIISMIGCSSISTPTEVDTTNISLPQTIQPTATIQIEPTEIMPLATINPTASNQLQTNHSYDFRATFLQTSLRLRLIDKSSSEDIIAEYELDGTLVDEALFPTYTSSPQLDDNWLGTYLLHPINMKITRATYPISEIDGMFTISHDRNSLIVGECRLTGGRGQWCRDSTLWLFDLTTGQYKTYQTDVGWLYDIRFNSNDTEITFEGCLEQPNAYFGWCGDSAIVTVNLSDGNELNRIVITPTSKS